MGLDLFWWMPVYSAVSHVDFILIIFVISILSGLYTFWHSPKQNYPPGPKGWPLIGNVQAFSQKPHVRLFNLKDLYGDVYSLKLGSQDVVVVCSLAGIQEGLHERGDRFADRPNCPIYHTLYNGDRQNGISTGDYTEKAYIKRGFIQACLDGHYSNEEVIEHKITVHIADVVRAFSEFDGDAFNPTDVLLLNCLRISLWLVYGNQFESGDNNLHEILNTFTVRSTMKGSWLTDMPMFHLLDSKRKKQVCQRTSLQTAFQTKLVDKHKDTYDPDVVRDMIDQLLIFVENNEDRGVLTAEDMTYLLLDITGSGFQTIAVTMTWLLAYMAVYPDVQVKVQDEIDSVIGKEKVAGLEDQASLPFTVATILEVERLASVCPFLLPHRVTEKSILQGYDIPADTWILFNVWSLHHDPRLWRNPMKFDPTRFLKNGLVTVPDQFLPYGLGPRCCVGESLAEAELFLFFTSVLQRFTIQPPEGADISLEGEFTTLLKPPPFSIQAIERPNSGS